jgi:hypothetical protein
MQFTSTQYKLLITSPLYVSVGEQGTREEQDNDFQKGTPSKSHINRRLTWDGLHRKPLRQILNPKDESEEIR